MATQQKALPNIVKMRAERILKAGAKTAYRLDENDANLIKVVMSDDKVRYVNLAEGREVKSTELKVSIVDDVDTTSRDQLKSSAMISRSDVEGDAPAKKKTIRKKTVTKKKSTKK